MALRGAATLLGLLVVATAVKALAAVVGRWAVDTRVEASMLGIGRRKSGWEGAECGCSEKTESKETVKVVRERRGDAEGSARGVLFDVLSTFFASCSFFFPSKKKKRQWVAMAR